MTDKRGKPEIFNTDQGLAVHRRRVTGLLIKNGIAISMDGRDAWRDNAFIERLWRSVKYHRRGFGMRSALSIAEGQHRAD